MQHIGDNTAEVRKLDVEPDGEWSCENCEGDGKNSKGKLSATQNTELQRMLSDPNFGQEVRQRNGRRFTCDDALYSSLFTGQYAITVGDCPGEDRLPVTDAILRLLTDATPAEMARRISA